MNKVLLSVVGVFSAALIFAGTAVHAAEPGQTEGGDIYRVRNVTKNGEFTDPASATCGETLQFKVRIHNPGPSPLTNVLVKATLPTDTATSHSSQVTVSSESAQPKVTTDTAGVNLEKAAKLTYIAGSTELLDANNAKLQTLSDTIFTSGVTIDSVGVSTQQKRFVQFSVKTECPDVPKDNCPIPGKENLPKDSPECKETPVTPVTPTTPSELPQTGAGSVIAFIGLGALVASIAYYITSRRSVRS